MTEGRRVQTPGRDTGGEGTARAEQAMKEAASGVSGNGADAKESTAKLAAPRGVDARRAKEFLLANARSVTSMALFILGVVLVLLAWYGTAYTNILTEQIPYLVSGGLLGLGLIVVAGLLGVSAIQSREIRELRRDLIRMAGARGGDGGGRAAAADGQVYVVPGGRSFHVAGCPLLEGKDGEGYTPSGARDAGFAACKLCGPD